jgi:hypothetical protein
MSPWILIWPNVALAYMMDSPLTRPFLILRKLLKDCFPRCSLLPLHCNDNFLDGGSGTCVLSHESTTWTLGGPVTYVKQDDGHSCA